MATLLAFLCVNLLCALCVDTAMATAAPRVVMEMPPGPGNPRNSEGSFATLLDGRLMYAYSRYYGDSTSDHAAADIAARYSSDNGETWTASDKIIVRNHGGMNVMSASLLRLQSGELALFYLLKNSTRDCRPVMRRSFDEGATWGGPVECITDEPGYYVLNNDRVIQLRGGRILFAVSRLTAPDGSWDEKGTVVAYFSDDNGATWRRGATVASVPAGGSPSSATAAPAVPSRVTFQEPGVVELRDGRVLLWIRTDAWRQYFCHSSDRGETWTAPQPSPLVSPLSPASMKRLPAGDLLAIWNDHGARPDMKGRGPAWANGARTPLATAISRDEGDTWGPPLLLEDDPKGWFCYTAIHPLSDGTVLLAYCAYDQLAHSRIVKVPLDWLYGSGK